MKFIIFILSMSSFTLGFSVLALKLELESLRSEVNMLKDTQDGVHNHLNFTDSDNAKLRDDIARLRQDLDIVRYRDGR